MCKKDSTLFLLFFSEARFWLAVLNVFVERGDRYVCPSGPEHSNFFKVPPGGRPVGKFRVARATLPEQKRNGALRTGTRMRFCAVADQSRHRDNKSCPSFP